MSRHTTIMMLGIILVAGAITLPLSFQANAKTQPLKSLQCDTAKNCKVVFVNPKGDIVLQITNTANVSGGGTGGVDQVARDGVAALQNTDNGQNAEIKNLQGNNSELLTQLNNVKQVTVAQNNTINDLKAQVANLTEQLKNVVIDVNVENQTTNQTGGSTGNETGNQTGGGNQTNNGTIPTNFNYNGNHFVIPTNYKDLMYKYLIYTHTRGR